MPPLSDAQARIVARLRAGEELPPLRSIKGEPCWCSEDDMIWNNCGGFGDFVHSEECETISRAVLVGEPEEGGEG
jgi:hypothetical protein